MGNVKVKDRRDVTIYRDEFAYISHPTVAKLQSGDYLVAFNESLVRRPFIHPPSDPRYVNLISRSRDGGYKWETPRVAPDYNWTGVECPGITQISSGEVLLNQWQFKWYPLETARKIAYSASSSQEILVFDAINREWKVPTQDIEWDHSPYPWARGDSGCFVSISLDEGATWENTVKVDTSPYSRGYSPRPATELGDGTLLLALVNHLADRAIYVVRSSDRGKSWDRQVTVAGPTTEFSYSEPSILALPGNKVLLVCRENNKRYLCQSESYDGGHTWTPIRQTVMIGLPCHLVLLRDSRVLCVYGYRKPPFGIRACLSSDEGATWDYENELVIRDDMRNANIGYPTAIQENDGDIFVVYYGEDAEGVTYVMGSHFQLP